MHLTVDIFYDRPAFREAQHPRGQPENKGEFASKPGGGATSARAPIPRESGAPLPPHIAKLRIPPAWTEVSYSADPDAAVWVTGKDAKGRRQAIYSPSFVGQQAAAKFARIKELDQKFESIKRQNDIARKSNDPRTVEAADCMALIMATGVRPGSDSDTKADKQAYGATTLLGRHVVPLATKGVRLRFIGKKGVALDLAVTDPEIAKMLLQRKERAGNGGRLFQVSERDLLNHAHSFDGGGFKTKDFRTLLGTRTAMAEVEKAPAPMDAKSYKKAVMAVAKQVASRLGNTPTVALQSYINPVVFLPWRPHDEAAAAA